LVAIKQLYELRHACNVVGYNKVAGELGTTKNRLLRLCNSDIHGSIKLNGMLRAKDDKFDAFVKLCLENEKDRSKRIQDVHDKNEFLIEDLKKKRKKFAGIGTNKAKRRLNKAALVSPVAKAVRMALEIEDKSISAKNSYGEYQNRIYNTNACPCYFYSRPIASSTYVSEKTGDTQGTPSRNRHTQQRSRS